MKTIRLPDPFPRGRAGHKLEFGSSAWAADSCLVEWSQLEREWLESPADNAAAGRGKRHPGARRSLGLLIAGTAGALVAVLAGLAAWTWLG